MFSLCFQRGYLRRLDTLQLLFFGIALVLAGLLANYAFSRPYDLLVDVERPLTWLRLPEARPPLYWLNEVLMLGPFCWLAAYLKRGLYCLPHTELAPGRPGTPRLALAVGLSVALPALLFWLLQRHNPLVTRAWAAPVASDPWLVVAALALLGQRVNAGLRHGLLMVSAAQQLLLLLAAAAAAALTAAAGPLLLALAAALLLALVAWRRGPVLLQCALALPLWWALMRAGMPGVLAGAALGLALPCATARWPVLDLGFYAMGLLVVPAFLVANGGVSLGGVDPGYILRFEPASTVLVAALVKPLCGLLLLYWCWPALLAGARGWLRGAGAALLSGAGLSGALYFGGRALAQIPGNDLFDLRLAVLSASLLTVLLGCGLLRLALPRLQAVAPRQP